MRPAVIGQSARLRCSVIAAWVSALVRLLSRVGAHVDLQSTSVGGAELTCFLRTGVGLGSGVLCFVVMQTRPCLGGIATAWVVAAERLVL